MSLVLALVAAGWMGYAVLGRRWRICPRLETAPPGEAGLVVAVVPARNEAAELPQTLPWLLRQEQPNLRVVLVDDHSTDGTADVARQLARESGAEDRLVVLAGTELPSGWMGKVWAQQQGVERAIGMGADWIWLTDADIRHDPGVLGRLLATASRQGRDFVSVMARLRCETVFEKLLIPAFTYFFAMIYPFEAVGDDGSSQAGAAGGCMLVRRSLLERIGGMAAIGGEVIDDVALGRACKAAGGRLWLGYDPGVNSSRGYPSLGSLWDMVARSAYTQLAYQPLALAGCVAGLFLVYGWPVAAALHGSGWDRVWGLLAWAAIARTYLPMVDYLLGARAWAFTLPVAAVFYAAMTVTSAWRYHQGTRTRWKGRDYGTAD